MVAWAHTILSFTSVTCQDMNVHASLVLGLLILHTSLVKLNIKIRRKRQRHRERERKRVKGEEPCLILGDVRVSAVYGDGM